MSGTERCRTCVEEKRCRDDAASWVFFIIGLIAAFAIRAVTVLLHVNELHGKIAWYIGVIGFLVFFVYKFRINFGRAKLIKKNNLVAKVDSAQPLNEDDRRLMSSMLCALSSRKEGINYFFIFVLSAIALVLAVYLDFIH